MIYKADSFILKMLVLFQACIYSFNIFLAGNIKKQVKFTSIFNAKENIYKYAIPRVQFHQTYDYDI